MAKNDEADRETQARLAHIEALLIELLDEVRDKERKSRKRTIRNAEAAYVAAVSDPRFSPTDEQKRAAERIVQRSRAR